MAAYADLHLHTWYSDGSDRPRDVMARGAELRLAAVAITDHDTLAGLEEGARAARLLDLEFLPGVEISAAYGHTEIHVVGLGVRPGIGSLNMELARLRRERSARVDRILERLQTLAVPLTRADVEAQASGSSGGPNGEALGRVHVAMALKAHGAVRSVQEAFDRFLRQGRKAYVPKGLVSCRKALDLIHEAGGVAILAHPGLGKTVERLLPRLLSLPFDGLEVYHTEHTPGQVTAFTCVAMERDLLISGGSDCHGTSVQNQPDMGKIRLPYGHFERIKEAVAARWRSQ